MKHGLRLVLFFVLVVLAGRGSAQPNLNCGTPSPSRESLDAYQRWVKTLRANRTEAGPAVWIPLTFTFVRPASQAGQPLTPAQYDLAYQSLFWLEKYYQPSSLRFFLAGFRTVDNDADYHRNWNSDYSAVLALINGGAKNAVNVFVVQNIGPYSGYAYYPSSAGQPSNGIFLQEYFARFREDLMPHEVGHYFNLLHTFERGWGNERVDGSNCASTGDFVCDTPADPYGLSGAESTNCRYTGTVRDANGELYRPDPQNLMGYWICPPVRMTTGQHERAYQGYLFRVANPGSGPNRYDFSAAPDPLPPANLSATRHGSSHDVRLDWSYPASFPPPVLVERAPRAEGPWAPLGVTVSSPYFCPIAPDERVYFRVRCATGTGYSAVVAYQHRRLQTISFDSIPDKTYGDAPFLLPVKVNSSLAIDFNLEGPIAWEGSRLKLTGTGPARITATQPGDSAHLPASPLTRSFLVKKAPQTLSLGVTAVSFGTGTVPIAPRSSAGLPVQSRVLDGPATASGNLLTLTDYGQLTLYLTQPGDTNYLPAAPLTRKVCVNPDPPSLSLDPASELTLLSSSPHRNQWLRNGDTLRGATSPRLRVTHSGHYAVRVSNPVAECQAVWESEAKTMVITGLNALPAEWSLEVAPNPASDWVSVRLTAPGLTDAPVCELLDGLGRVVGRQHLKATSGRYEVVLPLRGLAAGVYGVRVGAGGRVVVGRLVVE